MYRRYFKRLFDIVLSLIAIIILSPLMAVIAILVKVKIGSPVIFKQIRVGEREKLFTIYKFRTMTNELDVNGNLLEDSRRLTRFGQFLRSTSLDELPELFNVVRNEMSLIGPRPLIEAYLPLYSTNQRTRHEVKPGLTGLAQINGRNSINWKERFDFDIEYVKNISFLGDVKILLLTIVKVLLREGIHSSTSATMEPFKGNN